MGMGLRVGRVPLIWRESFGERPNADYGKANSLEAGWIALPAMGGIRSSGNAWGNHPFV